jgi:hypothetical protein
MTVNTHDMMDFEDHFVEFLKQKLPKMSNSFHFAIYCAIFLIKTNLNINLNIYEHNLKYEII